MRLLLIFVGGAIGSIFRYLTSGWFHDWLKTTFPVGTAAVNCIGCFLFGFLAELTSETVLLSNELRSLIFIGFLGGFTTFSTFTWEFFELIRKGSYYNGMLYLFTNLFGGIVFLIVGTLLARAVSLR